MPRLWTVPQIAVESWTPGGPASRVSSWEGMSFEYLSNRIASYADFQSACAIARAESVADLNRASRVLRSVWRGRLTLHLHCTIGLLRARLRMLGGCVYRRIPPSPATNFFKSPTTDGPSDATRYVF